MLKQLHRGYLIVVVAAALIPFAGCKPGTDEAKKEAPAAEQKKDDKGDAKEQRIHQNTNGDVVIKLDAETQEKMALKVEALTETEIAPEKRGYARVLDPMPLISAAGDIDTAQAALTVSEKEFERLKILKEQNNTSERAFQAGEAALRHDKLALQAAQDKLAGSWGTAIANRKDLPEFTRKLTQNTQVLVRIDLPASETTTSAPISARIVGIDDQDKFIEAKFLSPALTVDPQFQSQGFIFVANADATKLPVGANITGYMRTQGELTKGILVPRSAIVSYEGVMWVYQQTGADEFTRKEISFDKPMDTGVVVTSGFAAGDKLVVVGAAQLLSEELKSQLQSD